MSDMKCHEEGISRMLLLPYLCSTQFHNPVMIGSHCAACFYSSLSIGYSIISFSMRGTYKN